MMLITTSRKPGQLTRSVARSLADALGAGYLNRGKAGVQSVLGEADEMGADKVLFVWERHGNPSRLVAFDMAKARQMHEAEERQEKEKQDARGKEGQRGKENQEIQNATEDADENDEPDAEAGEDEEDEQSQEDADETGQETASEPEQTAWMKPEVAIRGIVYHRRSIRRKGARIKLEDPFGERVAGLLEAAEGPNQIVLSRFGLKVLVDNGLVLELKFRT